MAPFKSSLAISGKKLLGFFNQRDLSLRGATQITRMPPPLPFSATGGSQSGPGGVGTALEPGNGFKYHFFTASGSLVVAAGSPSLVDISYLLVAGGGAGGSGNGPIRSGGGGGGAGGVLTGTTTLTPATTYPVVIGDGGARTGIYPNPATGDGSPSTWNSLTANGGGGGGAGGFQNASDENGRPGGSGGGGAESPNGGPTRGGGDANPNSNPTRQGYPGGDGETYPASAGSGGGAGGAGSAGGAGGIGVVAFSGDAGIPPSYGTPGPSSGRWFGGGGGESPYFRSSPTAGGAGGGGAGGADATVNTGGGGGSYEGPASEGGAGGSGILIVKYPEVP